MQPRGDCRRRRFYTLPLLCEQRLGYAGYDEVKGELKRRITGVLALAGRALTRMPRYSGGKRMETAGSGCEYEVELKDKLPAVHPPR